MPSSTLSEFDPNGSVLFLGSGFSTESINLRGARPMTGSGLRKHFIKQIGLPEDTTYDFQVLAEEYNFRFPGSLYKDLYEFFHISKVSKYQIAILDQPWLRIYTTNYDDSAESFFHHAGQEYSTFTFSDSIPNKLTPKSIIHLHGSVNHLSEDNVLSQLVLGETSYVKQYIDRSPWYTQFQADIRYATNLFIIGYSGSDYHISALLLENPELAARTFFIERPGADDIFLRRTAKYGSTLDIGMVGFAQLIARLPKSRPNRDIKALKSFRHLSPLRDKKSLQKPTASEIFHLLVYGNFNYARASATLPEATYIVPRSHQIREIVAAVERSRSAIVDARLGNGKTIALYLAFLSLAEKGYTCVALRPQNSVIEADLVVLKTVRKLVILIEDFTAAQDMLTRLSQGLPDAKFLIEVRTSIAEIRYHDITKLVPAPFEKIGINRLDNSDYDDFKRLCVEAGIPISALADRKPSEDLRDALIKLLESPIIRQKINETISPIFTGQARRRILIIAMLLADFHISADPTFIRMVTGADAYREFGSVREIAGEVFDLNADEVRVRSSIFAEFAVLNLFRTEEIGSCIVEASLAAANRKQERKYRVLMGNLMQYSNLDRLFAKKIERNQIIVSLYEKMRFDNRINDEPLFWLQYAIAMIEADQKEQAEQFIETAYERAKVLDNFKTYQIDTQALRVYLLIEAEVHSRSSVNRLQKILVKLDEFNSMLSEESQRVYAMRVLENLEPFIRCRVQDLSVGERNLLKVRILSLIRTFGTFSTEYRAQVGSDAIAHMLERCIVLFSTS